MDTNNYTLMGMADADYQFSEFNDASYIIDRSDSMETDYVRVATEPKLQSSRDTSFVFNRGFRLTISF